MGAATAALFASQGARFILADFNEEHCPGQAQKIVGKGGDAVFVRVDVTRAEQARQMLKAAVDRYGVLDVAVNNAARAQDTKPIAEMDEGDFDAVQKVDLKGVVLCLKYEILQMMAQGGEGLDRQYLLGQWNSPSTRVPRLQRGQAWRHRIDQIGGARLLASRHPGQRHCAGGRRYRHASNKLRFSGPGETWRRRERC